MKLIIDTSSRGVLYLELTNRDLRVKKSIKTDAVSERILGEIEKILKKARVKLSELTEIWANPGPGPFSSIRSGVAVANALAFALNISLREYPGGKKVGQILPVYDNEPNITRPKRK